MELTVQQRKDLIIEMDAQNKPDAEIAHALGKTKRYVWNLRAEIKRVKNGLILKHDKQDYELISPEDIILPFDENGITTQNIYAYHQ